MKQAIISISKIIRIFETIMKYVLVGCWAVCLFVGGTVSIAAAIFGIIACVITCLV